MMKALSQAKLLIEYLPPLSTTNAAAATNEDK
jgi:hypothetical protein